MSQKAKKSLKVLLVEDIAKTVRGSVAKLEGEGIDFDIADTLGSAEEALSRNEYGLMMLDLRMPTKENQNVFDDRGGEKLVSALRSGAYGELNKDISFLVVTAHDAAVEEEEMLQYGSCLGVCGKLDPTSIEERIREFVGRNRNGCD